MGEKNDFTVAPSTAKYNKFIKDDEGPAAGDYLNEVTKFQPYNLEYHGLGNVVEWFLDDIETNKWVESGCIMKTYEERFPADQCQNVVNKNNEELVAEIDKAAKTINKLFRQEIVPLVERSKEKALEPEEKERLGTFANNLYKSQAYFTALIREGKITEKFPFDAS